MGTTTFKSFCLLLPGILCFTLPAGAAASLNALRPFGFPETGAALPQAELIEASNGKLYGTTTAGGTAGKGALFRVNKDGSDLYVLKSFGLATNDAQRPVAAVIEASDGLLYGTTSEGGALGRGTVFQLDKGGANFVVLHSFDGTNGANPEAKLLEATDGWLYGTASGGGPGTNDYGVVFRLQKNGSGFQLLKSFGGTNGANPEGGLIEAADGGLYGTTCYGGGTNIPNLTASWSSNVGTVFRLEKDGSGFSVLKHFHYATSWSSQTNGNYPYGQLVQTANGFLFGMTSSGGRGMAGTLYRVNTNGANFATLRELTNATWANPVAGLTLGSDGMLYGATFEGGTAGGGILFRIDQNGSNYLTLTNLVLGLGPAAGLTETAEGELVGTTLLGGTSGEGTIFKIKKDGSGFTILRNLSASGGDGRSAYATLTSGRDGQFYGTTRLGSDQNAGTVFAIDPLGRGYRVLAGLSTGNIASPTAALVEGENGMLYGNSLSGGTNSSRGVLFQLSRDGQGLTRLHDFGATGDGYFVNAALTKATNGYFYGVTTLGSALFRVLPDGSDYSVVKLLSSGALNPMQQLLQASDGKLYGTAYFSYLTSTTNATNGCIFRIDLNGSNYTVLKFFTNRVTTGANPNSPLLEASDGKLYGTTYAGGTTNEAGAVYRLNKDGTGFQLLRGFTGVQGDGRHPCGRIVEGADGFIYGTTERGGTNDQGTLFQIAKDGSSFASLASFDALTGAYPRGGVTLGPNDALYGTTDQGGSLGNGTIFRYGTALEYISQVTSSNGQVHITCVGASGTNYVVERSSDLANPGSWTFVQATNAPGSGDFQVVDQTPVADRAFYRLKR